VVQPTGASLGLATGLPANPFFNTKAFERLPSDYTVTPEPLRLDWLRGPRQRSGTLALLKTIRFAERFRMEVRGEISNPTNTPSFGNPGTDMSSPATFGVISDGGSARSVQLGARLRF